MYDKRDGRRHNFPPDNQELLEKLCSQTFLPCGTGAYFASLAGVPHNSAKFSVLFTGKSGHSFAVFSHVSCFFKFHWSIVDL